jgi:ribonuclease HI
MKFDFGKYAGSDIRDVPNGYLEWLRDRNRTIIAAVDAELRRREADEDEGVTEVTRAVLDPRSTVYTQRLTVICDGACLPVNPGGYATYAFVVYEGEVSGARGRQRPTPLDTSRACVGKGDGMTNNVAEYHSVLASLRWVEKRAKYAEVEIRSDSQIVVRQINGEFACDAEHLRGMWRECRGLLSRLPKARLVWVRRDETYVADALTRVAYHEAHKRGAA